jgi:hypothetical protein
MFYHVTPTDNVPRIMAEGLVPQRGPRSVQMESEDGIYLFKTMEGVENALSNWLGEEFGENIPLTLLGVQVPPEAQKRLNEQGDDHASYEVVVTTPIPAQYIQILSEDI